MAASEYGLSIVLDFQDNATAGMQSASSAFSSLSGSADKLSMGIGGTASSLLDINTSVVGMSVLGSQFQNMGQSVLGVMKDIGSKVVDTSSSFENFQLTLKALYGDADKASKITDDLFAYANKSPFEVEDLQGMVVTLKSQGLEAFDQMIGKTTGLRQETMAWIGDLQAFRPNTTALKWKQAIQNFLSGDDNVSAKMLRNILDVGDLSNYLGHDLHKTVEGRMQDLIEIVEKTGMAGMQDTLSNTWSIVLSNMADAWTTFTYRIGFGNKENNMYRSATNAVRNLLEVEKSVFSDKTIINSTSEALYGLIHPAEKFTEVVKNIAPALTTWLKNNPQVIKFGTNLTVVGGAALVAMGSLLRLSGAVINYMLNVQRLGGFIGIFNMLGNSIQALTFRSIGWASALGLLAVVLTRNYGNISGLFGTLSKQAKSLFGEISNSLSQGKTLTQSLIDVGLQPLVDGLNTIKTTLKSIGSGVYNGIAEALGVFGFHSEKIEEADFNLKTMLNHLGEAMSNKFGEGFQEKWGGTIDTFGRMAGAFIVAYGGSTLLAGGLKLLGGAGASLLTNFKVIATTLMSPTGLMGLGLGTIVAGYKSDFLGLKDVVSPMVDNIRSQMKTLKESFGAKNSEGKNNIIDVISKKIQDFNKKSKDKSFQQPITQFMSDGTSMVSDVMSHGISMGEALGQGISAGLLLFGGPIQKAIGAIMFGYSFNIGNLQEGVQKFVPQLINAKDLLLEMSTGYGQKSVKLADKFGLTPFAEGIVNAKRNIENMWASFTNGFLTANPVVADTMRKLFGEDLDLSVNGILNKFGELSEKATNWLSNTTIFGKSLMEVLGGITSKATLAVPLIAGLGMASKLIGFDVSPITGGLNLIKSGFSLVLDGAKTTAVGIKNAFVGAKNFAVSFFTFARDTIKDFWANASGRCGGGNLFGNLLSAARNGLREIRSALNDTLDSIEMGLNYGESASKVIGETWNDAFRNIGEGMTASAGSILAVTAQIATAVQVFKWQSLYNGVMTGLKMFGSAVLGASKMVIGLHGVALGLAAVTMGALAFGTISTSEWQNLNVKLGEQQTLLGKIKVGYEWFTDNLSGVTTKVRNFIDGLDVQSLVSKFMGLLSGVGDAFVAVIGGENGTNGIADVAGSLIDKLVDSLANGSSNIGSAVQRIFNSVTSAIQTYAPTIGQNLATIMTNAIDFVGENSNTFFETAFTIINSFVDGLLANSDRIAEGVSQLVSGLANSITKYAPDIIGGVKNLISNVFSALNTGDLNNAIGTLLFSLIDNLKSLASILLPLLKAIFHYAILAIKNEVINGLADIVGAVFAVSAALLLIPGVREAVAPVTGALMVAGLALRAWGAKTEYDVAKAKNTLTGGLADMNGALAENSAALDANKQKRLEWATAEQAENFKNVTQGQLKAALENNNNLVTNHGYDGYIQDINSLEQAQNSHTLVYRVQWNNDTQSYETVLQQLKTVTEEGGKQHTVNVDYVVNGHTVENAMNKLVQWGSEYHLVTYEVDDNGSATQALTDTKLTVDEAKQYCSENGINIEVDVVKKDDRGVHEIVEEETEEAKSSNVVVTPTYQTTSQGVESMTQQYEGLGTAITSAQTAMEGLNIKFYTKDVFEQLDPVPADTVNSWNTYAAALNTVNAVTLDVDKLKSFTEAINSLPDVSTKTISVTANIYNLNDRVVSNLSKFTGSISMISWDSKTVTLDASGNIVSDSKTMASNMNEFTKAYKALPMDSLTIGVYFNFEESLMGLDASLASFTETPANVTVGVNGADESKGLVDNLKESIDNVKSKTVLVLALVSGKTNVDKLAESIGALQDKTVKITANYTTSGSIPNEQASKKSVSTIAEKAKGLFKGFGGQFASGTDYFEGGTALINEKGGEIVDLPRGTRIIPHDQSVEESFNTGYKLASNKLSSSIETLAQSTSSNVSHTSTPTKTEHNDYSVNFGAGSIVVRVDNAKGEADYEKVARTLMKYIEKEQRRNGMARRA
mgnify:FL=1|jgi:hypothetical protein